MCVEVNSVVNTANENARQRQDAAAAFGGTNAEVTTTRAARHGCYCQTFNCFGSFDGIGCPECVKKAAEGIPVVAIETGRCRWNCEVCACKCISTFDKDKRQIIATAEHKNKSKDFNNRPLGTPAEAASYYVDIMSGYLERRGMQEMMAGDTQEPSDDMVQNACVRSAMNTFNNICIHSNPMVRRGVRHMVGKKNDTLM